MEENANVDHPNTQVDSATSSDDASGRAGMKLSVDQTGSSGNTSMESVPDRPGVENMESMNMKPTVTLPQLLAVTLLTILTLGGGVLLAALFGNFSMSAVAMQNGSTSGGSATGGLIYATRHDNGTRHE